MPLYTIECEQGHRTESFMTLSQFDEAKRSRKMRCDCGSMGHVVIMPPMLVKVAADVCYDSPIDGRPITSWQQRQEDLKRNNCSPYDPEQKTDYHRRIKETEADLDRSIERHVEETIEKMPGRKRAELWSELTEQGKTLDVVRTTHA